LVLSEIRNQAEVECVPWEDITGVIVSRVALIQREIPQRGIPNVHIDPNESSIPISG
jgi:hypothetical protein